MKHRHLKILIASALMVPVLASQAMDFDGDGIDDLTVYHSELGDWYTFSSDQEQLIKTRLGGPELQPVIGDFDGDGITDLAHYQAREGRWTIRHSSDNTTRTLVFGFIDAAPVPADYDGDGITDIAVYVRQSGTWHIVESATGNVREQNFGWFEAKPVPADYDGDGKADLAVFHRDSGSWYIFGSATGFRGANFGFRDARPVPADYDGDDQADLAVYDGNTGTWYLFGSSTGFRTVNWGWNQTRAIPGDYDGDGQADIAVYQREIGRWYIWESSNQTARIANWGWNQATPLASYRHGGIEGHVILSFGNSITYGIGSACNCPLTGYPALLKRLLGAALGGHFDTINAGSPGEMTSRGRTRLPAWLDQFRPDMLLLMEGTNDHFAQAEPDTIENNLRAMIQQAQAAGCDVVLATIPPVITNQYRNRTEQARRIRQFNPRIYSIANRFGIPVAPIYEAITEVPDWQSTLIDQPTANHPNDAGYRIVTQTFLNTIRTGIQNGQFY